MKKAIMSVLTVWMLVSSMFIGLICFSDIENVKAPYIPHSPIRINSDTEFASMAGIEGWAGNGLPGNPYIIEGYDINGSGVGTCIYIGNTTVYFKVKDCYLHEANVGWGPYHWLSGITLYNVQNGIIANNNISYGNFDGIYLDFSSSNTIINNYAISNEEKGISLFSSNSNIIANNIVSNHIYNGICLSSSNSNVIANNTASNNDYGIYLAGSSSNTITNNTASNNHDGISIDISSNGNYVTKNTASNNFDGIRLYSASSNTITNNTASNNSYGGILIDSSSSGNNIINNTVSSNDRYGFWLDSSNSNIIANNTASNNDYGIYLTGSSSNSLSNNNISSNNEYGIYLSSSNRHIITYNEMLNNGIYIYGEQLGHWNTHIIDTTNTVNGKAVHYLKNQTGDTVPLGAGQVILANSTNVVIENQNASNGDVGIQLGFSSNNTIANTTASSNNWHGIHLYKSSTNIITNNTAASNNWAGIYLSSSSNNIIINNTAYSINDIGIYLYLSISNTVANNNFSYNRIGIYPYQANNNTIANNTVFYFDCGIYLRSSNSNTILNNTISSNNIYGIRLDSSSSNNKIYHNNIINNKYQAYDDTNNGNQWDNDYPSGGNYWSDYIGNDSYKGPNQDIPGGDGIGDTPYIIDANSQDNYPLIAPFTNRTYYNYMTLKQGWNLISIPLIQEIQTLSTVLQMIEGYYDAVQWYNSSNPNKPWMHNKIDKPFGNDLSELNESMAFWVHINNPGDTIFLYNGTQPTSNQSIPLHPGWNMVGYPSLSNRNRTTALNNLTFGVEVDAIWTFDAATQTWEGVGAADGFELGKGYWVHATQECVWEVPV